MFFRLEQSFLAKLLRDPVVFPGALCYNKIIVEAIRMEGAAMTQSKQNFRGAFRGFNREDVVQYIESAAVQQETALHQLQDENQKLQEEIAALQADKEPTAIEQSRLTAENQRLTRALEEAAEKQQALSKSLAENDELLQVLEQDNAQQAKELQSRLEQAEQQIQRLTAENLRLERELSSRSQPVVDFVSEELAAYRRAEQTERQSKERAAQAFDRINGLLADLTVRLEEGNEATAQVLAQLSQDFERLHQAAANHKLLLEDAGASLRALRLTEGTKPH
jgi:chromosome segregation ATPase